LKLTCKPASGGEIRSAYLLQRRGTQLDGDVLELPVALGAEVADDVGVLVRLAQQLHLPVSEAEALRENPLHRHLPVVKLTPGGGHGYYMCYRSTKRRMICMIK